MGRRYDTISFLTDFGTADEFVGVVKSVIRDIAGHVTVIDLTHEVAPFDVRAGSLALARSISYVACGVVLAVVDPGVGTDRRLVAIEVADGDGVVVGPDNGLLAPAVALAGGAGRAVVLTNAEFHIPAPGATFAGRDIMGPVAAHLCNGVDLCEFGDAIDPALLLPGIVALPRQQDDALLAEVLWVDRFGNCQLNVGPLEVAHLGEDIRITVGETSGAATTRVVKRTSTFRDLGTGALGLLTDSYGMMTLCLDRRSASQELQIGASDQVVLKAIEDDNPQGAPTVPVNLRVGR